MCITVILKSWQYFRFITCISHDAILNVIHKSKMFVSFEMIVSFQGTYISYFCVVVENTMTEAVYKRKDLFGLWFQRGKSPLHIETRHKAGDC